jgi:hypothetical protein
MKTNNTDAAMAASRKSNHLVRFMLWVLPLVMPLTMLTVLVIGMTTQLFSGWGGFWLTGVVLGMAHYYLENAMWRNFGMLVERNLTTLTRSTRKSEIKQAADNLYAVRMGYRGLGDAMDLLAKMDSEVMAEWNERLLFDSLIHQYQPDIQVFQDWWFRSVVIPQYLIKNIFVFSFSGFIIWLVIRLCHWLF